MSLRLDHCPGVGPVLATALAATVADPKTFRSARKFRLDWAGAKQNSNGCKTVQYQQKVTLSAQPFVAGALAVIRYAKIHGTKHGRGSRHCWRGGRRRLIRTTQFPPSIVECGLLIGT